MNDLAGRRDTLWRLLAGPTIWAVHFLASYITAAIWCAKFAGPGGSALGVRVAVGIYTVSALAGIAFNGWMGYRRHSYGQATVPHDFATAADRRRFLGFAALLLSGLSAVAVLYVGLAAFMAGDCQ